MSFFVKICGVRNLQTALASIEAGADAIGLVFARSPRQVDLEEACAIADMVRGEVQVVAVFRRPATKEVGRIVDILEPDLVQADHTAIQHLASDLTLPVYREGETIGDPAGLFLFEGPKSGQGVRVEETVAADVSRNREMVLAGGLSPANVSRAIERIRPVGVDVSSGVETARGLKSPRLIEEFVSRARVAHERLVTV